MKGGGLTIMNNGSLKRRFARASIVLFCFGLVCMWIPLIFARSDWAFLIILGTIAILCALTIKYVKLRCPSCGFGGLMPQWSQNDTYHCPKCGELVHWE